MKNKKNEIVLDELMTAKEVAVYLRVSDGMLYEQRAMGVAPNYLKLGKIIRYRKKDIDAWVAKQQIELAENKEK